MWMIYHEKSEFFNTTEDDLRRITKIACVKILLEQCWQKGFHVNSWSANDEENLTTGFFLNKNHFKSCF